jgi:hypothetical protein
VTPGLRKCFKGGKILMRLELFSDDAKTFFLQKNFAEKKFLKVTLLVGSLHSGFPPYCNSCGNEREIRTKIDSRFLCHKNPEDITSSSYVVICPKIGVSHGCQIFRVTIYQIADSIPHDHKI